MTPPQGHAGTLPAPLRARRVSGPSTRVPATVPPRLLAGLRPRRRAEQPIRGLRTVSGAVAVGVRRRAIALPDARVLDRLIRGRGWIALIAVGLMGIVFTQVSLLGMNAGIGRAVQASQTLERQNTDLRTDLSRMGGGARVQDAAARLGYVVPSGERVSFLDARAGDARRAADAITPPDPLAAKRAEAAQIAAVQARAEATAPATPTTGAGGLAASPATTSTPAPATTTPTATATTTAAPAATAPAGGASTATSATAAAPTATPAPATAAPAPATTGATPATAAVAPTGGTAATGGLAAG